MLEKLFGRRVRTYTISIAYKSGATRSFTATEFKVDNGVWSWTPAPGKRYRPLLLGVENIESVYQQERGYVRVKD